MKPSSNKLLVALGALGLTASVNAGQAKADPVSYSSFGEFFSYARASVAGTVESKASFVENYPNSQMAGRVAREVVDTLSTMSAAERASFSRASQFANAFTGPAPSGNRLGDLPTGSVGRAEPSPGRPDSVAGGPDGMAGYM